MYSVVESVAVAQYEQYYPGFLVRGCGSLSGATVSKVANYNAECAKRLYGTGVYGSRERFPNPVYVVYNIYAATATTTRNKIITILGMLSPKVVSVSPEKSNITYWVRQKSSIEEVFTPLADKLKSERANMPRVIIIFCKRCEKCAILYQFFLSKLTRRIYRASWSSQSFPIQTCRHVYECY